MESKLKTIDVAIGEYSHYSVEAMIENDREHAYVLLKESITSIRGVYSAKDAIDKILELLDEVYGKK